MTVNQHRFMILLCSFMAYYSCPGLSSPNVLVLAWLRHQQSSPAAPPVAFLSAKSPGEVLEVDDDKPSFECLKFKAMFEHAVSHARPWQKKILKQSLFFLKWNDSREKGSVAGARFACFGCHGSCSCRYWESSDQHVWTELHLYKKNLTLHDSWSNKLVSKDVASEILTNSEFHHVLPSALILAMVFFDAKKSAYLLRPTCVAGWRRGQCLKFLRWDPPIFTWRFEFCPY